MFLLSVNLEFQAQAENIFLYHWNIQLDIIIGRIISLYNQFRIHPRPFRESKHIAQGYIQPYPAETGFTDQTLRKIIGQGDILNPDKTGIFINMSSLPSLRI